MKILVIQLARLGDIYSTWPSLRAMRRENPDCQIDVMVRPRFSKALDGLDGINSVIELPVTDIFSSLLSNDLNDMDSLSAGMDTTIEFVEEVKAVGYTQIINLSFSPMSSFLTKLFDDENVEIRGYSRQSDGFLSIPDDASAFFYAQAGVHQSNRFHVNDLFSEICGLELKLEDYNQVVKHSLPPMVDSLLSGDNYIVVHVGASTEEKTLSQLKMVNLLKRVQSSNEEKVVLIGSNDEVEFSMSVAEQLNGEKVINLVGKTSLLDLFPLIRNASLMVGADSAPIHISSLVATPVYNLSNESVRYWETGPKSAGSRIRVVKDFDLLGTDMMHEDINSILLDQVAPDDVVVVEGPVSPYQVVDADPGDEFRWNLIEAIYLGKDFPVPRDLDFVEAVRQLQELNGLSLQQFHAILKKEEHEENMNILGNVDDVVESLVSMVPDIEPIVKWYQTEKLRIGPGDKEYIVSAYTEIHTTLAKILSIYLGDEIDSAEEEMSNERELTK